MPNSLFGSGAVSWERRAERITAETLRRVRLVAQNDPGFIPTADDVFSPLGYGAVGDGVADDGPAVRACLVAARAWANAGVEVAPPRIPVVDLRSRVYLTNSQIEVPGGQGLTIQNGTLLAGPTFPSGAYLMRVGDAADPVMVDGFRNVNTTIRNLYFDNNHVGGGLLLERFMRCVVERCLFTRYQTCGLKTTATGSHELMLRASQFGEYWWGVTSGVGYDRPDLFVGTGVEINSNDNHLSDLVIQLSKIGLKVTTQANVFNTIHIWTGYVRDPATVAGPGAALTYLSTGLWITASASFNTFSQLYMDGCEILWEDPWKTTITDSIFLHGWGDPSRAFIRFMPMGAGRFLNGVVVADCTFQVQALGLMKMTRVDTSAGTFSAGQVVDCRIEGNKFTGVAPVYTTIRTRLSQDAASTWTFDLAALCAFGAVLQDVQMTAYQYSGGTNLMRVSSVVGSVVVVTSYPVATPGTPGNTNATVYLDATINDPS